MKGEVSVVGGVENESSLYELLKTGDVTDTQNSR